MHSPSLKNALLYIGIIGAAFLLYYTFFNKPAAPSDSLLQAGNDGDATGAQVLALLNEIRGLNVDTKFFSDKYYIGLVDNTVAIPPLSVGRANPFAPVAGIPLNKTTQTGH